MYVIDTCVFCRYANHVCVSHTTRTNHGDECDFPPIIRTPSIVDKSFSFGEERVGLAYYHDLTYANA
jgi:hypothetical protein